MLHSLAAQVDYFQNLIRQHPGWEFCGVFADEAKTGTKDERPEYQKMLEKCRNREVDLVITKSICTEHRHAFGNGSGAEKFRN